MSIDKNQQRARAQQFELEQLAKGVKKPAPVSVPSPKIAPPHVIKRPKTTSAPKLNLEATWVNDIGQTICAGDRVLVVAQGYSHSIKTMVGTFLGARVKGGRVTSVSCEVQNRSYQSGYGMQNGTARRSYPSKRVYKLAP